MTPRESRLAEAFQDCLARTSAGESPEQALARHPADLRAELRAALVAALTLRQHRPAPAPAFAARLQGQLDETMAGLYPPESAKAPWWSLFSTPRLALRLAAVLVAVLLAGTSLTLASANSRPGDLLYPVHTLVQRLGAASSVFFAGPGRPSSEAAAGGSVETALLTASPTPAATEVKRQGVEAAAGSGEGSPPAGPESAAGATGRPAAVVRPGAVVLTATATRLAFSSATPFATPSRTPTVVRATVAPTLAAATATEPPTAVPPEPTDEPPDATAEPTATRSVGPGALAGRVTDRDGQPVPGARVRVKRTDRRRGPGWPGGPGDPGGPGGREVLTDADGRYRVDGLRPDDYLVAAEDPRHGPPRWYPDGRDEKDAEPVTVRPGVVTEGIDIRFERREGGRGPGGGPGAQSTAAPSPSPSPTSTPADPAATPIDPTATPAT